MNTDRKHALTAGISLLSMAVAAGYAYGYVYRGIVIQSDTMATLQNLKNSSKLFLGGIMGWVVILILDLIVSWTLYKFFERVNSKLSALTGATRAIYSLILGAAIVQLIIAHTSVQANGSSQEILESLTAFETYWSLGLIVFGVHLIGLGLLSFKLKSIANVFAWLLLIAGVCYTGVHSAKALFPNLTDQITNIEMLLSLPMAVGELAFAIWLVVKGGKIKNQNK